MESPGRRLASYDLAVGPEIIKLTRRSSLALVHAWSATEHVGSRTTHQDIVAPFPVATAWKDPPRISLAVLELAGAVVARPTIDQVITGPPPEAVTALAAADFVVSCTTDQGVISFESEELDSHHCPRRVCWWIADYDVSVLGTVDAPAFDGEAVLVSVRGKPCIPIRPTADVPVCPTLIPWRPRRAGRRGRRGPSAVVEPVGTASERGYPLLRGCLRE